MRRQYSGGDARVTARLRSAARRTLYAPGATPVEAPEGGSGSVAVSPGRRLGSAGSAGCQVIGLTTGVHGGLPEGGVHGSSGHVRLHCSPSYGREQGGFRRNLPIAGRARTPPRSGLSGRRPGVPRAPLFWAYLLLHAGVATSRPDTGPGARPGRSYPQAVNGCRPPSGRKPGGPAKYFMPGRSRVRRFLADLRPARAIGRSGSVDGAQRPIRAPRADVARWDQVRRARAPPWPPRVIPHSTTLWGEICSHQARDVR